MTLTSTSDLVKLSGCGSVGQTLVCKDLNFDVTVTIDPKQGPGTLPVTVTDAAGATRAADRCRTRTR